MKATKIIKPRITIELLKTLHDCNMADANDPKYDYGVNDLPLDACKQASTYGHISNALDSLGPIAKEARQIYVDNGDIDDAVRYVKEQYYISHISEF